MNRISDEQLEAASIIEGMDHTDGLLILPISLRNHVSLQVTIRHLQRELETAGCEFQTQVVTSNHGQPLLYLIDTRDWPERMEQKLMSAIAAVKAGDTPADLQIMNLPTL